MLLEENRRDEMGRWGVGGSQEEVSWELGAVSMREGKETRMEGMALGLPHRPLVPSRTVSGYSNRGKISIAPG